MLFKLHELIVLLVIGALLVVIAIGALVRDHIKTAGYRAPTLTAAAFALAEAPEKLHTWVSSIGVSPFELEDRFPEQSGFVGETNDDELYLLLNRYDGELEKSVVDLIDLRSFQVLHRWEPELDRTGDGDSRIDEQTNQEIQFLFADVLEKEATHSSLTSEGDLVVSRKGVISKVNACSDNLWQASKPVGFPTNASLELDDAGNIWVSVVQKSTPISYVRQGKLQGPKYIDNLIVQLSPSGKVMFSKSVTDILVENHLSHLVFGFSGTPSPDPIYLVDIQPALTDGKYWQKGDVLISLKHLSLVLLYRPSTDVVLWHSIGHTNFQSDVGFIGNSRIVIFDNNTPTYLQQNAKFERSNDQRFKLVSGHNRVLVYDFTADQYAHHLDDALSAHQVRTANKGRSQVLPNSDLYIEESEFGRLLYFNADGSLLWSHVNRATDNKMYAVSWSRILHRDRDITLVRDFLNQKDKLLAKCR